MIPTSLARYGTAYVESLVMRVEAASRGVDWTPQHQAVARIYLGVVFAEQRALFARVYPRLAETRLEFTTGPCGRPDLCGVRDFAYAEPWRNVVVVSDRLALYPRTSAVALLRHEFAHVADPVPYIPNTGRERWADATAEAVGGQRIYYDSNDLQTTLPGTYPRPAHLHQ